jgi:dihydroflavonol-4-reductase
MRAFVTGSTGLLGNNLVRMLVEQGHEVKALVRSKEKAAKQFGNLNITYVTGDMNNIEGFTPEMSGCDVLFHTAAYFREYSGGAKHWQELEKININGTLQILEAAEKQGVKKVIYVSSSGVIGQTKDGKPSDENTPPGKISYENLYFKSKVLAEEAVAKFIPNHKIEVAMVLPGAIVGPGDIGPTGIGKLIMDFTAKKIPGIIEAGISLVDAREVAHGMISAVEKAKNGDRFIIGGRFATFETIMKTLEKVSGVPTPKSRIPYPMAMVIAIMSEFGSFFTRKEPLVTRVNIKTLNARIELSSAKAERELGVNFRSLEESLRDSVNWYSQNGYIKLGTTREKVLQPVK